MSIFHMRIFWGAFDVSYSTPEYSGSALVSGGSSAAAGSGVGVRRASLRFTRMGLGGIADDDADMHFDFMNITSGSPDDTWTTTDFTDLEAALSTWWTAAKVWVAGDTVLDQIRWYRVGTGVVPPNPAERVTTIGVGGSATGTKLPPQIASSLTLQTARRRNWGRTYLPSLTTAALDSDGSFKSTFVDDEANALNTLAGTAATKQFYLGVTSNRAGSFFAAESIRVDDIADVIRRRRFKRGAYHKILP